MQKHLLAILSTLALAACGTQSTTSGELAGGSAGPTRLYETEIHNLVVTPTNGGINPDFFAFDIKADVTFYSSPCNRTDAKFEVKQVGADINVRAVVEEKMPLVQKICIEIAMVNNKTITTTIRGQSSKSNRIVFKNVETMGKSLVKELHFSEEKTVVYKLEVKPTNGGINPDYFAYVIKGTVKYDANFCYGIKDAKFVAKKVGKDLLVHAVLLRDRSEANTFCPMAVIPKEKVITITVRDQISKTNRVVVDSVEQLNRRFVQMVK